MAAPEREVGPRPRRILDYLNDGEEHGAEEPVATPRSPAAAAARSLLLPRLGWARARLGRLGRRCGGGKVDEQEEAAAPAKCVPAPPSVSTSVCETDSDTRPSDLGVGLSLVFLLAKTSDEFNKMVRVRTEMETLLKEIKDQVRKNSDDADASKAHNVESTTSSCVTDRNESADAHFEDQVTSSSVEAVSYEKSTEDGCCRGRMDVLEEEFHAEMELLQVNYGSDIPSFLPEEEEEEQDNLEPLDEITEYRQDNDDAGETVQNEDEDGDDDDGDEYNGVCPVELERRLHELLHQRNQERIEELETALRSAEKKLVEKEMEVRMWKDTAKLALQRDDNPQ